MRTTMFTMIFYSRILRRKLLVVPTQMENEIIMIAHTKGHFGAKNARLRKSISLFRVGCKIPRVIGSCVECLVVNAKLGKKEGLLAPIDKGDEPLGTYHVDHVGPMTATKKQYNYILVVVDAFSKFVWLYPTKDTGTDAVLDRLQKQSAVFGNPRRIITDRGAAFTSRAFEQYCEEEGIQHLLITTGVPRGNGQVERMHKVLVPMLAKLSRENPDRWYKYVDRIQQYINSTSSRSTQHAPFKILTGLEMRLPDFGTLKKMLEEG
ncbi:hypothetical protein EVAR_91284_1 [Eumeta japonica]|uniref:Integrase catalytic domain-containing protein n=1 Tax=Eumeta variegata TaxID=151549 RepID=A0A4C1SEQ6_EUMVA|nr:hypothetical protein EVAR_91284_1 [Eumeta japonica]